MTKPGESDGFKASTFLNLLVEYLGTSDPLDYMVFNDASFPSRMLQRYAADGQFPVELDRAECESAVRNIVCAPVLASGVYIRHDPYALAKEIMGIVNHPATELERQLRSIDMGPQGTPD